MESETSLLWVGMDASELPGLPWDDAWIDYDSGAVWLKKSFAEYDSDFLLMIKCDEDALPAYENEEQWKKSYINSPHGTVMEIHQSEIEGVDFCGYPTALYFKTKNFLEAEYHRVFDPYYDIKSLTISNWQQNGNEATFFYQMTHTYYNKDPDTVDYIKKAKEEDKERYEKLYNDYLAEKEANAEYKVVLNGDNLELYSNVSPKGIEWQPVKIDDYILSNN